MDAQLIRVEAERKRRLERRVGRFRIVHPILRQVPLEAIGDLMEEGRKYARRQWSLYLAVALIVALLSWFVVLRPWLHGSSLRANSLVSYFAAFGTVWLVMQVHIRAYLNHVVPSLHPKSEG
jgi:hypothetical protein